MKSLLTTFLLLSLSCIYAQLDQYISPYRNYDKGEKVAIFGDNVNLRSAPNIQSEVLEMMPFGATVIIREAAKPEDKWVKIQYHQKEGFVSVAMISIQTYNFGQQTLYTQLRQGDLNADDYPYYLNIRIPDASKVYREYTYPIWTTTLSLEMFGNRGIKGVDQMLHINYLAEACGIDGGGRYIFIRDNVWREAFSYTAVSDAGVFYWVEEFTFPDEHHIPNKIKYVSESYEVLEDGPDYENPAHAITHKEERLLEWKNNAISPKFEQTSHLPDL